ncbi:MAG: polysaccharide biosynthesis tyrosine autokinase [bacterium]
MNNSKLTTPEPGPEASGSEESRVDIRLYLHIVRRRLWVLLAVVGAALGIAVFLTSRLPNQYRAEATVVVDLRAAQILGQNVQGFDNESSGWWQGTTFLKTQEEVLRSGKIARLAAEKLDPKIRSKLLGKPEKSVHTKEDLEAAGYRIAGMREIRPGKDSRKFTIASVHTDPALAAAVANAIVDAYVAYSLSRRQGSSTGAETWLSARLEQLEDELKLAEQKLQDFKKKHKLLSASLQDRLNGIALRIVSFNRKLDEIQVKRIELAAEIYQLRRLKKNDPMNDPSVIMVKNPIIDGLKQSYSAQHQKLIELRGDYLEKHPKIQAQEAVLENLRKAMQREAALALKVIEAQHRVALTTESEVRAALRSAEKKGMALGEKALVFRRMDRVAKQKAKYYELVLSRYVESGLAKQLNANNVRILDRARAPLAPFSPRLHVNLAIAFAIGLVLGLGLVFLLYFMDNTVKTQEDIEHLVGLPFLGLIPSIAAESKRDGKRRRKPDPAIPDGTPVTADLFQWMNPKSQVAEHCRSIRTNLLFMSPEKPLKALLITSSVPREGKTTVAMNIAISMAQSGEKTLIVDTDMRRPRVHKAFGITPKRGVSAVLVGECEVDDVVVETPVENLYCLPCGATPPNPAELLHTKRFRELIPELLKRFDRVIFDSPPVGAVTDPVILSKAVDGTILVVKTGVTARQLLAKTGRVLTDVNANVLGVVLNDIDPEQRTYGGYYHYYYYKRRYYSYYGDSSSET